jgi:hypothetical protein
MPQSRLWKLSTLEFSVEALQGRVCTTSILRSMAQSQEVTAGFFRTVIAANRLRFAK